MKSLILPFIGTLALGAGVSHFYSNVRVIVKDSSPPTPSVATGEGDLYAEGDLEADGTLNVAGAATLLSTLSVSGKITPTGGTFVGNVAVTDTYQLTAADCGKVITVSAGIDTKTITLPEASTVLGCVYRIIYIGADGGALLDISPLDSDADGIEGSCTLAASVVTFSGTADADVGFTKATIQTGDTMTLAALSASQWGVLSCTGIAANN